MISSPIEKSRGVINFLFYLIFIYFQGPLEYCISDNTEDMPTLFKDMTKWVSNLVEMKIASKRFPSEIDHLIEHDVAHEEESIPILEFDQIVIEKNKSYGIEDWSKIGY